MNKYVRNTLGLLGLGLGVMAVAETAAKPPNIVLFLIDDLGWRDLGTYGSTFYQTPAIDRLAKDGVKFTDAYAACAVCTPSRAALLTGKYPARLLMTNWTPDGRWNPRSPLREGRFLRDLPLEEITLAEALREAGYVTGNFGKWHLGGPPFSMPEHHGFDVNVGGHAYGAPGDYFYPYKVDWPIPSTGTRALDQILTDGEPGEYLTERLTDEAVAFIQQNQDKPFFLYFPHYAVHTPLQARPEVVARYAAIPPADRQGDPTYAAMVESVDDSVARVVAALEQAGIAENTLVIFTSDNGGHWRVTQHAPLRGHKGTYWEGGIRVPLIVSMPGLTPAGRIITEPVMGTDLYPTILAAAGLPLRPNQHEDGLNLLPLFREATTLNREGLFWHFPHYNNHPETRPASAYRRGNWKLIESFDPGGYELYNLMTDLGEVNNLWTAEPARGASMLQELEHWRRSVGAESMRPNPDYDPAFQSRVSTRRKAN